MLHLPAVGPAPKEYSTVSVPVGMASGTAFWAMAPGAIVSDNAAASIATTARIHLPSNRIRENIFGYFPLFWRNSIVVKSTETFSRVTFCPCVIPSEAKNPRIRKLRANEGEEKAGILRFALNDTKTERG